MNSSKKKKLIIYILLAFLAIGITFYTITNESDDSLETTPIAGEVLDDNGNIIFSDGEPAFKNDDTVPAHPDHGDEVGHNELETVFQKSEDIKKITNFEISSPQKIDSFLLSSSNSKIVLSEKGHIFIFANETQLQYFNLNNQTYTVFASDVTKAKRSSDGTSLVYEQKFETGYKTYQYDYEKEILLELVTSTQPLLDFGKVTEFFYFKTTEKPTEYFYTPTPDADETNKLKGMNVLFNTDIVATTGEKLVTYSQNESNLYMSSFGETPIKQFSIPLEDNEFLINLNISPFDPRSAKYIALTSPFKDDTLSVRAILNGTELQGINNITKTTWIDKNLLLLTAAELEENLYLFNTDTKQKFLLAGNVSSFSYDESLQTIFFSTLHEKQLRKIVLQN